MVVQQSEKLDQSRESASIHERISENLSITIKRGFTTVYWVNNKSFDALNISRFYEVGRVRKNQTLWRRAKHRRPAGKILTLGCVFSVLSTSQNKFIRNTSCIPYAVRSIQDTLAIIPASLLLAECDIFSPARR